MVDAGAHPNSQSVVVKQVRLTETTTSIKLSKSRATPPKKETEPNTTSVEEERTYSSQDITAPQGGVANADQSECPLS